MVTNAAAAALAIPAPTRGPAMLPARRINLERVLNHYTGLHLMAVGMRNSFILFHKVFFRGSNAKNEGSNRQGVARSWAILLLQVVSGRQGSPKWPQVGKVTLSATSGLRSARYP